MAVGALTDSPRYEVSKLGVEGVEVHPSGPPTNFFTSIQKPAGTEVTKSYGEVGQIPDAMFKTFMSRFEGKDAPNPHDVAEAVAKLVSESKGSRAARTVVGAALGSDKINRACPGEGVRGPELQSSRKNRLMNRSGVRISGGPRTRLHLQGPSSNVLKCLSL